jgi:DNA replication and repair protein RecF
VAALRLAQCQLLVEGDTSATILVDDLPAELDTEKRQALLKALAETGAQIFVSGTEMSLFEGADFSRSSVFHVEQGSIKRLD